MQVKQVSESPRTFVLVLEKGDEVIAEISAFANSRKLGGASIMAIGAFDEATLAFYCLEEKQYDPIPVREQVEVVSLLGNVSRYNGESRVHCHATLGRRDGSLVGGHLLSGKADPTLEIVLTELDEAIPRRMMDEVGLPLIRFT